MTGDGGSERREVWRTKFAQRIRAIGEIVLGGWILTLLAGFSGLLAGFIWKWFSGDDNLSLAVVLGAGGIYLIPMLVVVAKVWEVNLSLFGNRVNAEHIPTAFERREPPGKRIV
jgi:hypothetical protein